MNLYQNPHDPGHVANIEMFERVVNEFPDLHPFQPSPNKAPWHVQAVIDLCKNVVILNFWPHTGKAQVEGQKSVEGEDAIRVLIGEAFIDAAEEPFDVIEG